MKELLSTKEVAAFLNINEKMVYTLISEKGLPATKVTGKWLFPLELVRQWIESGTINYPEPVTKLPPYHGLILIAGSNDLLLDAVISNFNSRSGEHLAMFGMTGSMGGIKALRKNMCHIASSHLVGDDVNEHNEYNFPYLKKEMGRMPAVVNFCFRQQGLIVQKGNPLGLTSIKDLDQKGLTMVNRALGTGTRHLLDKELNMAGIKPGKIKGYDNIKPKHMDIGLTILEGKADAGPGIRPVAEKLKLDFIPLCWERFDLLISKDRFFDQGIQLFLGAVKDDFMKETALQLGGYDTSKSGQMVYQGQTFMAESED
ncbi:MoeA [Desulfamplus magnetovallimortis]|uniref:MoeA n=1 Tax=Desulfamplus magnetovallimortis TaxID=1246637 RepID=A0A1W1H763_9BACT|nr:helix-turn-helix transcriptional regulator [Desulfamplus magnetovallimortis]SLM28322.1 MoeA [Desulfamplus magnetovallimortis]